MLIAKHGSSQENSSLRPVQVKSPTKKQDMVVHTCHPSYTKLCNRSIGQPGKKYEILPEKQLKQTGLEARLKQ
jgi:hypothetical protein